MHMCYEDLAMEGLHGFEHRPRPSDRELEVTRVNKLQQTCAEKPVGLTRSECPVADCSREKSSTSRLI
jgi:hypothetical protein